LDESRTVITASPQQKRRNEDRVCPRCGHIGPMPVRKLPSIEFCQFRNAQGLNESLWRINVAPPGQPVVYVNVRQDTSEAEIAALVDRYNEEQKRANQPAKRKE
jgi:hypothetical protein